MEQDKRKQLHKTIVHGWVALCRVALVDIDEAAARGLRDDDAIDQLQEAAENLIKSARWLPQFSE